MLGLFGGFRCDVNSLVFFRVPGYNQQNRILPSMLPTIERLPTLARSFIQYFPGSRPNLPKLFLLRTVENSGRTVNKNTPHGPRYRGAPHAPKKWNRHLNLKKSNVPMFKEESFFEVASGKEMYLPNHEIQRFAKEPIASGTRPCISWETCSRSRKRVLSVFCLFCRLSWQLCRLCFLLVENDFKTSFKTYLIQTQVLAMMACCHRFAWAHLDWKGRFTIFPKHWW